MHGDVIVLGASSWRIDEIGHDRVTVTPAPGVPGKLPFWKGDAVGRPIELGRAMGAFVRELEDDLAKGDRGRRTASARLRETHDLDERAADNLIAYLDDERETTGVLPTDRRVVIERFRDELGDWRICLLTPFGGRVHAPWSMAIESRLAERLGLEVQTIWSDDGIAIRLPEGDAPLDGHRGAALPRGRRDRGPGRRAGRARRRCSPAGSARTPPGRSLLPRRRPGTRTPLWQQRQRAADLLAVASRYGSLPDPRRDVPRVPVGRLRPARAARGPRRRRAREIAVHSVETVRATPFASSLLFDYVAAYMYDGDAPLAERRAQALTLDRDLLRELLGQEELRELLDPDALADLELSLQALSDDRRATTVDGLHDLLRRLGDLTTEEVAARVEGGAPVAETWLDELRAARRAVRTRIAGEERWIAIEDVARYRDGVGAAPPAGVPEAFLAPVSGALDGLLARWARTHGPFLTPEPARRWGLPVGDRRGRARAAARGRHHPARRVPPGRCRTRVVRSGRAPPPATAIPRAAAARGRAGRSGRARAVPARVARHRAAGSCRLPVPWLGGARAPRRGRRPAGRAWPIPASVLERDVLPARIPGYQPRLLDELGSLGEVAWVGRGSLGRDDGRIVLLRPGRDALRPAGPPDDVEPATSARHDALRAAPRGRGASFYRDLHRAAGGGPDRDVLDALWDLVWAGEVTNDTFAPLRALRWKRTGEWRRPAWATRPADRPRPARGGRALVARRGAHRQPDRAPARPFAGAPRAARRPDPGGRRGRGGRRRLQRGLPGAAGAGGGRPDPARLLRRRAGCRAVRPGGRARPAARRPRPRRRQRRPGRPPPGRGRPGAARTARHSPGRDATTRDRRPIQRAAGAYVVLVDGVAALYLERGGSTLQTLAAGRRLGDGRARRPGVQRPRGRRPGPRARRDQGGRPPDRRVAVPRAPAGGRVPARLPRASSCAGGA